MMHPAFYAKNKRISMPNFKVKSYMYPLTAICFVGLWSIIFLNALGQNLIVSLGVPAIVFIAGMFIENSSKKKHNFLISKNLYQNYRKNSIEDPYAIERSSKLQFIRLWHYSQMGPLILLKSLLTILAK